MASWTVPLSGQDDPLSHGHALIIGTWGYSDPRWPRLDDIQLQVRRLQMMLKPHFDTVQLVENPTFDQLDSELRLFTRVLGNRDDSRLFIYYAGHGYTEIDSSRNEYRGYITGADTPYVDGSNSSYAAARVKALSMEAVRGIVSDANARQLLFVFDSCFAGTVFTSRSPSSVPSRLSDVDVRRLLELPVREFITAGDMQERIPAKSPLPQLLQNALEGDADPYNVGVVTGQQLSQYLFAHTRGLGISPREGKLPGGYFDRGEFLFRVGRAVSPVLAPQPPSDQVAFQRGTESLSKRDFTDALRWFQVAADRGYAPAQFAIGTLYDGGLGVPQNFAESARWYRLAAEQGNAAAQFNLGSLYQAGQGVAQNSAESLRLYRLAAAAGHAKAQTAMGSLYEDGSGVNQDYAEAMRWYRLAADQGHATAQLKIGLLYASGKGVPLDVAEALRWLRKAEMNGSAPARDWIKRLGG
jgi:hypothetical protein